MSAVYLVGFRPQFLDLLSVLPSGVASTTPGRTTRKHAYLAVQFNVAQFSINYNAVLFYNWYCGVARGAFRGTRFCGAVATQARFMQCNDLVEVMGSSFE